MLTKIQEVSEHRKFCGLSLTCWMIIGARLKYSSHRGNPKTISTRRFHVKWYNNKSREFHHQHTCQRIPECSRYLQLYTDGSRLNEKPSHPTDEDLLTLEYHHPWLKLMTRNDGYYITKSWRLADWNVSLTLWEGMHYMKWQLIYIFEMNYSTSIPVGED